LPGFTLTKNPTVNCGVTFGRLFETLLWSGKKIQMLARQGVTQKQAVMDLIEEKTRETTGPAPKNSFLHGIEHLSGSVNGPGDLSKNPVHMKDFGR